MRESTRGEEEDTEDSATKPLQQYRFNRAAPQCLLTTRLDHQLIRPLAF